MDRIQILTAEIVKAHKLAHHSIPPLDEVRMEAGILSNDLRDIPDIDLQEVYTYARIHGLSNIPTSKEIVKAKYAINQERAERQKGMKQLAYRPSHECSYCPVVCIRIKAFVPDPTEWELDTASKPITENEIKCVMATTSRDPKTYDFWNTSPKSPYRGML